MSDSDLVKPSSAMALKQPFQDFSRKSGSMNLLFGYGALGLASAGNNDKKTLKIMGSTFLAAGAVNVLQLKEQKLKKEIGTAVTIGNLALGGFLLYRGLKKD